MNNKTWKRRNPKLGTKLYINFYSLIFWWILSEQCTMPHSVIKTWLSLAWSLTCWHLKTFVLGLDFVQNQCLFNLSRMTFWSRFMCWRCLCRRQAEVLDHFILKMYLFTCLNQIFRISISFPFAQVHKFLLCSKFFSTIKSGMLDNNAIIFLRASWNIF